MNPNATAAPQGGMFDIRWRILGMQFRIQPSFWIVNAIFAWLIYSYIEGRIGRFSLLNYILVWLFCILVSVFVHELGHVITGRIFGQPGNVTLAGFGGQTTGEYERLRVWQRIIFYAAGPAAGFGLAVFLVFFDPYSTGWNFLAEFTFNRPDWKLSWCIVDQIDPLLRMGGSRIYLLTLAILLISTLFTNILNLLPIIPLDGGMIFKEFCCLVFPSTGLAIAFIWSMFLALGAAAFYLVVVLINYRVLPTYFVYPFLFPELSLFAFAVMAYRAYASYRELASAEHHSHYMERD